MPANAVTCHHCHTRIESLSRHDWRACRCPLETQGVFVDGGDAYVRRGWGPEAWFVDEADGKVYDFRETHSGVVQR